MATTQEIKERCDISRAKLEENEETQVAEINTIDELFRLRLFATKEPRVTRLRIHKLIVVSGVSGPTLKLITQYIPKNLVAEALEVNPANLARLYQRKYLSRTQTEVLEDLARLWGIIDEELFAGDQQMMRRWLETPVPALDGEPPMKLMASLTGRKLLNGHIKKLKSGDYS